MRIKVAQPSLPPTTKRNIITLTKDLTRVQDITAPAKRPGKLLVSTIRRGRGKPHSSHHVWPRVILLINDNQCVKFLLSRRLDRRKETLNTCQPVVNFADSVVVTRAHIVQGQPQKKG